MGLPTKADLAKLTDTLSDAVHQHNVALIVKLLDTFSALANIEIIDQNHGVARHVVDAMRARYLDIGIVAALKNGFPVDEPVMEGGHYTLLRTAVMSLCPGLASMALAYGANPNQEVQGQNNLVTITFQKLQSAHHMSDVAALKLSGMAEMLLRAGALPKILSTDAEKSDLATLVSQESWNEYSQSGTPIVRSTHAVSASFCRLVAALCEAGANPNEVVSKRVAIPQESGIWSENQNMPLLLAAISEANGPAVLALVNAGADISPSAIGGDLFLLMRQNRIHDEIPAVTEVIMRRTLAAELVSAPNPAPHRSRRSLSEIL